MMPARLRVLLAEQELSETALTLRSLCAEAGCGLELVFVGRRSELAHALLAHCPDVAFLQLALLQPGAHELLRVLHRSFPSTPLILFAHPADTDCAVSCLSVGAQDFMLEGFMDERTMARALRSTLVRQVLPSPPKQSFALSICFANPEQLSPQIGQQISQLLRSFVRSTDQVTQQPPGTWTIGFSGASETNTSAVLRRITSALARSPLPFLSSVRWAITASLSSADLSGDPPSYLPTAA